MIDQAEAEPLSDGPVPSPLRLATIAVEQTLTTIAATPGVADIFVVATSLAPAGPFTP